MQLWEHIDQKEISNSFCTLDFYPAMHNALEHGDQFKQFMQIIYKFQISY